MKVKKAKQVKKYSVGGAIAAQVGLGALQGLIGGGQFFGGTAQAQKLKAPSTASPRAFMDLYQSAQNQKIVQQNLDEINRSAATYLQALQAGGPQSVAAGISNISREQGTQTQDVLNAQVLREIKAAEALALADERALGRERDVYEARFGEAQAARSAGLQNVFGAAGSAAKGLLALETGKNGGDEMGGRKMPGLGRLKGSTMGGKFGSPEAGLFAEEYMIPDNIAADGAMITGGKFSHKTNPIDIVRKGEKIGEMTGGEVILNPSQQKKLSKESAYFRQLLKKFNKQK